MTRTLEFLAAFRSPDEPLHLRAFRPKNAVATIHNAPQMWTTSLTDLANPVVQRSLKEKNRSCGIYFVVNSGGDCDEQIRRFVAWFVENDSLPLEEQHKKLDTAPIQPSIRVETRKSVHAYWLIAGDCWEAEWRDVQARLIANLDGDSKIKNPARLMRLPNFFHLHQNGNGLEKRKVVVHTFEPERRYSVAEMCAAFSAPPEDSSSLPPPPPPHNGPFDTWEELNTEAGIRIRNLAGARVDRKGWTHAPGLCHGRTDGKALFVAPDGAYGCHKKCSGETIRLSLGLPAQPLSEDKTAEPKTGETKEEKKHEKKQSKKKQLQGHPLLVPEVEPWPESINAAAVLAEVSEAISNYVSLPPGAADAIAVWDAHTYALDRFEHTPRLHVTSPDKRCGKTLLRDVQAELVCRPLSTENLSTPVLFRVIEAAQPTLLADECDTWLRDREELRGLLNSGHKRGREELRAIGESLIESQGSTRGVIGYGRYCERLECESPNVVRRWSPVVLNFYLELETGGKDFRQVRLQRMFVHLIDLMKLLNGSSLETRLQEAYVKWQPTAVSEMV